jgi:hypothetical protein
MRRLSTVQVAHRFVSPPMRPPLAQVLLPPMHLELPSQRLIDNTEVQSTRQVWLATVRSKSLETLAPSSLWYRPRYYKRI